MKYKIGRIYWDALVNTYGKLQEWACKNIENKILYFLFSIIDILIFIISYFIMWICGYKID